MTIDAYSFGHIVIDGTAYDSDVLIFPDGQVDPSWWRDQGHVLTVADIASLIETNPDLIVCGTGASGMLRPEKTVSSALAEKGIEFCALPTGQAIDLLTGEFCRQRVAAGLHLTC